MSPEQAEPTPQPRPDREGETGESHDSSGLDLARNIARSIAGRPRTSRPSSAKRRRRSSEPSASGAHPDERDPQTIDATIGRLIAEQGWSTDVRVHGVFSRWDVLVGSEVAQHVRPEAFADGRLRVRTDSTAWATQMKLLAPTVLRRLNDELGDGTVSYIDVAGPSGPSWKKGRRSVRGGRGPRDTYG